MFNKMKNALLALPLALTVGVSYNALATDQVVPEKQERTVQAHNALLDVMPQILSHSNVEDLMKWREVSKYWSELAPKLVTSLNLERNHTITDASVSLLTGLTSLNLERNHTITDTLVQKLRSQGAIVI